MEDKTNVVKQGVTYYLRLPPAFARHVGIDTESEESAIPFRIKDEVNKKGQKFISTWREGQ